MDLGFLRDELGEDPSQTQRVFTECRPHPVTASRCRVAFIEDQVDDAEHRREAFGALLSTGNLERHALVGERAFGADDALGDGGLGDEERARDLLGCEAAEQPEGERHPRLDGQHGMAGREDEAQEVVADVVCPLIDGRLEIRHRRFLFGLELVTELLVLPIEPLLAAPEIDRPVLGGRHQPRARVAGNARLGPLLERGEEGVLRQVLGQADIAYDARQAGDEPGRFNPPDRVDGAVRFGGRHGYRSDHLRSVPARRPHCTSPAADQPWQSARVPDIVI